MSFLRRFSKNQLALAGLIFIVILVLAAIFAPLITSYGWKERTPELRQGPSTQHWFGTDTLGYDVYTRVVYGARVSLKIGVLSTLLALLIGVTFGAISGFFGGRTDYAGHAHRRHLLVDPVLRPRRRHRHGVRAQRELDHHRPRGHRMVGGRARRARRTSSASSGWSTPRRRGRSASAEPG